MQSETEEFSDPMRFNIKFNDKVKPRKPQRMPKVEVDMLIVCKIENEFGYPEHYVEDCLRTHVKNDATTCYYLLKKEDKNELISLL